MAEPDRYILNHCRVIYDDQIMESSVLEDAHVASNAGSWVISGYQMRDVMTIVDGKPVSSGKVEPTGRTERIDRLTEATFQDVGDTIIVSGFSDFLAAAGIPEEDRMVTMKIVPRTA
jgi:hypothetical protein